MDSKSIPYRMLLLNYQLNVRHRLRHNGFKIYLVSEVRVLPNSSMAARVTVVFVLFGSLEMIIRFIKFNYQFIKIAPLSPLLPPGWSHLATQISSSPSNTTGSPQLDFATSFPAWWGQDIDTHDSTISEKIFLIWRAVSVLRPFFFSISSIDDLTDERATGKHKWKIELQPAQLATSCVRFRLMWCRPMYVQLGRLLRSNWESGPLCNVLLISNLLLRKKTLILERCW